MMKAHSYVSPRLVVLVAMTVLLGLGASGCGDSSRSDAGGPHGPPPVTPSGYLLLTKERLAQLRQMVADGDPRWQTFQALVDEHLGDDNIYDGSPENLALAYLLSGEPIYADAAASWTADIMQGEDVRFDSYLHFGSLMRHAALVLNYCAPTLSGAQRAELVDYLDSWTRELWFDNQGSGWGLDDPGNNYHHAFLQGTAYAAYALREVDVAGAQELVDLLLDRIESPDGVLDYLQTRLEGGGWLEGANYGERSKQRLYDALAVVASMGGDNHFSSHAFFGESIDFAIYQLQPDRSSIHPEGDLARESAMLVSPAERDYLLTASSWLGSAARPSLARWYVDTAAPTFDEPAFRGLAFKDLLFGLDVPAQAPDDLPTAYLAEGTGWLNLRSDWSTAATSLTVSAAPLIEQSHQHLDVGSFVIFKRGWLALDAATLSDSGLTWSPCAHNGVCVPQAQRFNGPVAGLVAFEDQNQMAYVAVDAGQQHRHRPDDEVTQLLAEHTREMVYLRPDVLVVYDRVEPLQGAAYEWRMHFPVEPSATGAGYRASHAGANVALVPLLGSVDEVARDDDLPGGASDAWRLVELASDESAGRFLNVISVADGTTLPEATLLSSAEMDGVALRDAALLFSRNARGAPPALPFSYQVPGDQVRDHVIANLDQAVDVSASATQGGKTITVTAGSAHLPSAAGVVRLAL